MKLVRFGAPGAERPGLLDDAGNLRDLSGHVEDIAGEALSPDGLLRLAALKPQDLPIVPPDVRLGPCVGGVGKFICVGLNYVDHALETGAELPAEPILFLKATSAISGPNDPILKPRDSTKLDWEVELGIIIGKTARYVEEADALDHIAGYCLINDVSERAFQLERHGTWDKGKGCDSFGPIGPWILTRDGLKGTDDLSMWLDVNGHRFQDGSTGNMFYKPAFLIAYISRFMSLHPGDVISTGTPAGVGLGQKPPRYLEVGDVVELGIEHLGVQRQVVVLA
jgi:2,4-diketo-3-deoxy-L-fuconate hydrolase